MFKTTLKFMHVKLISTSTKVGFNICMFRLIEFMSVIRSLVKDCIINVKGKHNI